MGFDFGWRLLTLVIGMSVVVPVMVVFASWFYPAADHWSHLWNHMIPNLLSGSLALVLGVSLTTGIIGVSLAWFVAIYQFPGRDFFRWSLLAPLAIPPYTIGFVYVGLLDYSGPLRTFLRDNLGSDWFIPEVRGYGGAVLVLSLALYPYVYLMSKNAFSTQGHRLMEAGRILGQPPGRVFWRLSLPAARPFILGSLLLVAMETLADFGTVSILGYDTFTTAIYKAWYGFYSLETAAQLASLLVTLVFSLVWAQSVVDRKKKFVTVGSMLAVPELLKPNGQKRWLLTGWCSMVFICGFGIPVFILSLWATEILIQDLDLRMIELIGNSLILAAGASLLVAFGSFVLTVTRRHWGGGFWALICRLATLGYALPGSVLAIGVYIPAVWIDHRVAGFIENSTGYDPGLLITGTGTIMIAGLSIRFLAVGFTSVGSYMVRVPESVDEASRNLGVVGGAMMRRLHWPLLRNAVIGGGMLAFVDVLKEMPLTLMTRPFGWDTLSVRIYEMTSEGEWVRAALPALLLVISGLIPVAWLARKV